MQRHKTILVIDHYQENSASRMAAGLFNPVTGRKMVKSWMADELFPYLHTFYRQIEKLVDRNFFYSMPIYRPFVSVEEQNEWMARSGNDDLSGFIESIHTSPIETHLVQNEFGGVKLKQCGYVNTVQFCEATRAHIKMQGVFREDFFDEDELVIEDDGVQYRNETAQKIIFCQGERARSGKLFSWLPIRPLKGETLSLVTQQKISTIFNRGVYVVPDLWRVGATYQFNDESQTTTPEGLAELTEKLNALIRFPFTIESQAWGMRPTTPDRRPILGPHPDHPSVVIFNGLGTKGVSLAPYFSEVLTRWLENGTPINKEVDIHRYKHYNYDGNLLR